MAAFTPQTLPNSSGTLIAHWAARLESYNDNDAVGTMNGQSGTSFDATQGTEANKPTFKTNIINGQDVFRFDGGDFLTSGSASDWKLLHDGTDFTVFIVFATSTSNPDAAYVLLDTNGGFTSVNIGTLFIMDDRSGQSNNETMRILIGKGVVSFPIIDHTTSDDVMICGEFFIASWRYDSGAAGDNLTHYYDGISDDSDESANLPHSSSDPNNTLNIGRSDDGSFYLTGDVAEILIYSGALDTTDRVYVEDNLRDIYYQKAPNKYTAIDTTGDYDGLGFSLFNQNNKLLYIGRRGTGHNFETAGKIRKWESDDGGASWAQSDIVDSGTYDDRNVGGGKVPATNTIILFYGRYNVGGTAWQDIRILRSTDHGDTWNDEGAVNVGSDTLFSPNGPLVELPSGKLMQTFYGNDGTNYRVFVQYSSDDGETWGSGVDVENDTTIQASEAACVYISGATDAASNLLLVTRDNNGALRQYKSANGGSSWTSQGVLPYSTGTGVDVSPWLYYDGSYVHLVYTDRTVFKTVHAWGVGSDLLTSVNNWINPQYIHIALTSTAGDYGYPSIVQMNDEFYITLNDGNGTADEADIYRSRTLTLVNINISPSANYVQIV